MEKGQTIASLVGAKRKETEDKSEAASTFAKSETTETGISTEGTTEPAKSSENTEAATEASTATDAKAEESKTDADAGKEQEATEKAAETTTATESEEKASEVSESTDGNRRNGGSKIYFPCNRLRWKEYCCIRRLKAGRCYIMQPCGYRG